MSRNYKSLLYAIVTSIVLSCAGNDDGEIGDKGYFIYFRHRPAEDMLAYSNYYPSEVDTTCADLMVFVTSSFKELPTYPTPQRYETEGDAELEGQMKELLDPKHELVGAMPIIVEYRTDVCKSVRFWLHEQDANAVTEITDDACFYYQGTPYEWIDMYGGVLINSKKEVVGKIPLGMTIREYLAVEPMVFGEAHFLFPHVEKSRLSKGNYVEVEIELDNGDVLWCKSK